MDEGFQNLLTKANQGDAEALAMIGDCYSKGFHTEKDDEKAHEFYLRAAQSGNLRAEFMVGLDYLTGNGVKQDVKLAATYLKNAADNGIANAQYLVGKLYKEKVIKDGMLSVLAKDLKANLYFEKASKQGHAKAQIELACYYLAGDSKSIQLEKGLFWACCAFMHDKQADAEADQAQNILNDMIRAGLPGGKRRLDKMMETIRKKYPQYIQNPTDK